MNDLELLTVSDVASLLGVCTATVRTWTDTGRLPAYRTPKGLRLYSRAMVLAVAERRGADR